MLELQDVKRYLITTICLLKEDLAWHVWSHQFIIEAKFELNLTWMRFEHCKGQDFHQTKLSPLEIQGPIGCVYNAFIVLFSPFWSFTLEIVILLWVNLEILLLFFYVSWITQSWVSFPFVLLLFIQLSTFIFYMDDFDYPKWLAFFGSWSHDFAVASAMIYHRYWWECVWNRSWVWPSADINSHIWLSLF